MDPVYLALEIGAASFFAVAALLALRRGRLPFFELLSAAAFGILLEEGDQLIFQTYHYSEHWVLALDRAPVVIGLTWALIIAGAMRITDALGVRRRYAPVVDSVLAISLDLAFDAVAIRIGLWTWVDVGPGDGWFGVPWGNFYAWLFVTVGFSLVTRGLREAAGRRPALDWLQLLAPLPAFGILLLGLMPFIVAKGPVDPAPGGGGVLFLAAFGAFLGVAAWGVWGPDRGLPNGQGTAILDLRLAFVTRVAIHSFFLGALLVMGLALELPILLVVALAMFAAEIPLAVLVRSRQADPRRVSSRGPESGAARALPQSPP